MSYIYKTGRIELHSQIKRHAGFVSGRVLDIGAGNLSRYRDLFHCDEYITMDIAPGKNVDVVGKIEAIPFPDNSFDSLVCTQVIGDIYDLPKAFNELHRVLRPRGVVLITESLFDPLHDEPHDYWRFTKHSLRRLAEDAGLEVVVLEPRGGYHSVMAQLRARYWIERFNAHRRWYSRIMSIGLKFWGCGLWLVIGETPVERTNYLLMATFSLPANMLKITTSWDDGDTLDQRLAELSTRYGIKGTFYIARECRPKRLTDHELRRLAKKHEIGAHTLTHPDLRALAPIDQQREIAGSKEWLEALLGLEIKMFCYPKGLYDDSVISVVKAAGFLGARTTGLGFLAQPLDPFRIHTTVQLYPFPFRKLGDKRYYLRKFLEPYAQRAFNLRQLGVPTHAMYSWLSTAKATLDIAERSGQVFHLWGHSWEIEKYGMWNDLEKFLDYASQRKNCVYLTNSELLRQETI